MKRDIAVKMTKYRAVSGLAFCDRVIPFRNPRVIPVSALLFICRNINIRAYIDSPLRKKGYGYGMRTFGFARSWIFLGDKPFVRVFGNNRYPSITPSLKRRVLKPRLLAGYRTITKRLRIAIEKTDYAILYMFDALMIVVAFVHSWSGRMDKNTSK
jgi:hypothetical protein